MGLLSAFLCFLMIFRAYGLMRVAAGSIGSLSQAQPGLGLIASVLKSEGGVARYSTRRHGGADEDYDYDGGARSFPRLRRDGSSRDDGHRGGGGSGGQAGGLGAAAVGGSFGGRRSIASHAAMIWASSYSLKVVW